MHVVYLERIVIKNGYLQVCLKGEYLEDSFLYIEKQRWVNSFYVKPMLPSQHRFLNTESMSPISISIYIQRGISSVYIFLNKLSQELFSPLKPSQSKTRKQKKMCTATLWSKGLQNPCSTTAAANNFLLPLPVLGQGSHKKRGV